MEKELETSGYWKSFVFYKYAYRGWATTSRAKSELKLLNGIAKEINSIKEPLYFINAGVGALPLVCALANKDIDVFSFVENINDFEIATETADKPKNLHIIHSVWSNDYDNIPTQAKLFVTSESLMARFKSYNPIFVNIQQ